MRAITCLSFFVALCFETGAQSVRFTYVPPPGSSELLAGVVTGVDYSRYGVAVFINVFDTWWTKPFWASPITLLASDGTFMTDIVTGGQDACASQVAAYLVPLRYAVPLLSGQSSIPAEIVRNSLAHAVASKGVTGGRTVHFSGYDWVVKSTGSCIWGPGPNTFSDGANNVKIDSQGRLHLRITNSGGQWACAEIKSSRTLGYGTYRFYLDSSVAGWDQNVVLGMFTFSDDPDYNHREMDIEFSNGAVVGLPDNWQFVVQPYDVSGNRLRFPNPINFTPANFSLSWSSNQVFFQAARGGSTNPPSSGTIVRQWTYSGPDLPPSGNETLHMNLWLFNGAPPADGMGVEVIFSKFEFVPLQMDFSIATSVSPGAGGVVTGAGTFQGNRR